MAFTPIKAYPNFGTVKVAPPIAFPATIAASGSWFSDLIPAGFGAIAAACTSSQTGTLTLQRYADLAGNVPVGAAITQALSAATPAWVSAADSLPYLTFAMSISNSSGSTATITNCAILTGPL
jgi:hypothetical protein